MKNNATSAVIHTGWMFTTSTAVAIDPYQIRTDFGYIVADGATLMRCIPFTRTPTQSGTRNSNSVAKGNSKRPTHGKNLSER